MNIQSYLTRIEYQGSLEPNLQNLSALQKAHMQAVPFENLSIHYKQPILLNEEALYKKIVEQNRGGFCYELNGLFAWLLRSLGYKVEMLSAGVITDSGGFGPEFDHMTLLVHLEEDYLVDVGSEILSKSRCVSTFGVSNGRTVCRINCRRREKRWFYPSRILWMKIRICSRSIASC